MFFDLIIKGGPVMIPIIALMASFKKEKNLLGKPREIESDPPPSAPSTNPQ
jgi:hypothetical protein